MPLDFAILIDDGEAADIVSLSMDQHEQLIEAARELKLYRLLRFHDYFEDIDTWPTELPGLLKETAVLLSSYRAGATPEFLPGLYRLIERALNQRQVLHAIPD